MSSNKDKIWLSVPHMSGEELDYIHQAFEGNWLSSIGPNLDGFEAEVASTLGGGVQCLAVSSGSAALHLVLRYLGVEPGTRVAVTSMTFAGSAFPIAYQGGIPVFLDTDEDSYTLDPNVVENYLSQSAKSGTLPKVLIAVHLYGQHANIDPIAELCSKYGVVFVEDAAESLGAMYKGRQTATTADYSILSFNGNKIITTSGGGMVIAKDPKALAMMKKWANQSREPAIEYVHKEIGYNYRLSNVLAGMGRGQLTALADRVQARRKVAEAYAKGLQDVDGIVLSPEMPWGIHTRWLSVIRWDPNIIKKNPSEIVNSLQQDNIEARPVWRPMHTQPVFKDCAYFGSHNDERSFATSLCLPSSSSITQDEIQRVIDSLKRAIVQ